MPETFAGMVIAIIFIVMCKKLIKSAVNAMNNDAPELIENTLHSATLASRSLNTMASQFANDIVIDSLESVQEQKAKVGCNDASIITHLQLHNWMKANGLI